MAGLLVVPVDEINVAVGAVAKVDKASPGVVRKEKIGAVAGDVAGALGIEKIDIEAPAVKNYSGLLIVPVFISFRPRLGQSRYA